MIIGRGSDKERRIRMKERGETSGAVEGEEEQKMKGEEATLKAQREGKDSGLHKYRREGERVRGIRREGKGREGEGRKKSK